MKFGFCKGIDFYPRLQVDFYPRLQVEEQGEELTIVKSTKI